MCRVVVGSRAVHHAIHEERGWSELAAYTERHANLLTGGLQTQDAPGVHMELAVPAQLLERIPQIPWKSMPEQV